MLSARDRRSWHRRAPASDRGHDTRVFPPASRSRRVGAPTHGACVRPRIANGALSGNGHQAWRVLLAPSFASEAALLDFPSPDLRVSAFRARAGLRARGTASNIDRRCRSRSPANRGAYESWRRPSGRTQTRHEPAEPRLRWGRESAPGRGDTESHTFRDTARPDREALARGKRRAAASRIRRLTRTIHEDFDSVRS